MKEQILHNLTAECPWRDTLYWYPTIDSTNTQAKAMAKAGAPHGTVLVAGQQTGGRGRMGRTFHSAPGAGVYLSLILRPGCRPEALMHLTCAAGVAAAEAVERVSGVKPGLKWINDLVVDTKKLGGILVEMSVEKGLVEYAVIGIGINCLQRPEDFSADIAGMATSLSLCAGRQIPPQALAGALVEALWRMDPILLREKAQLMEAYRSRCITLGKAVQVIGADFVRSGKAVALDGDGGLWVEYSDGSRQLVSSGEVSVRGMYGYV